VHLASDLDFLIPDLIKAGCEVHLMRHPSLAFAPGGLWRYLPIGEEGKLVTVCDVDRMNFVESDVERIKHMANVQLRIMVSGTRVPSILIQAFALMDNHSHLVRETPRANLVDGMQWFQNTYTRRFKVKHKVWGPLFGGRYKAVLVQSDGAHRALADLPKNAPAKALLAHIITEQISVPQKWIAQTLHMGSAPYVSKLAKEMKQAIPRSKKWRDVKQSVIRFIG
jgi:hypothetical protein